jgi:hypothetical protein
MKTWSSLVSANNIADESSTSAEKNELGEDQLLDVKPADR